MQQGIASCKDSGYQEMTLSSLSTSDYRPLTELCDGLLEYCDPRNINIEPALPFGRTGFPWASWQRLQRVRKTSITFAPEAGTQRMRDTINKNVKEEDLLQSCRTAFEGGCNAVKLYFMLGLPTETDEDVIGIARLAEKVYWTCEKLRRQQEPRPAHYRLHLLLCAQASLPPFQWEAQITREEYHRRVDLLRGSIKNKSIQYNWHEMETSYIEAVLARGDRRLGKLLETVWRKGGRLDSWSEYFSFERWMEAFAETGIDPDFYALRERPKDEDPALEHDRHRCSPRIPVAGTGAGISARSSRRTAECSAWAAAPTACCRTACSVTKIGGK